MSNFLPLRNSLFIYFKFEESIIKKFTSEVIAKLEVVIKNPDKEINVQIKLGKPCENEKSMWQCQVELAGLNPSWCEVPSDDAFSAILLSLRFIGQRLKDTMHPDGKIYFGDSNKDAGHTLPIEYYFPDWAPSEPGECLDCKDASELP